MGHEAIFRRVISITNIIDYIQNLNCIDFSNIINSVLSGLFSIIAILPASYALITRYVEKQFCGMPISHLRRYKITWQIIPLVYLFMVYVLIIITDFNIIPFTGLLLIFMVYIGMYLYFMLIPIFNKNKFYKLLTISLSKQIIRNKHDFQQMEYYLIETTKSISNDKEIPSQYYKDILSAFKERVKGLNQSNISFRLLHLVRLLFFDDSEFFIEVNSLEIPIEHKYHYVNVLFKENDNPNLHTYTIKAKEYFTNSLKEYLKLHNNFENIRLQTFTLINNITLNIGLTPFLIDIYNADIYDLKYIDILYFYLIYNMNKGTDLNQFISSDKDRIFIDEFKEILEGKKKQFIACDSFTNKKLNVMEMVIKSHYKEM